MAAFSLTHAEVLTLSTLLHLPIQPNSVLCDWLAMQPQACALPPPNLSSLSTKGYFLPENKNQPIPRDLFRALTLAAINAADISVIIQRGGRSALTRFAQVGKGLLQYGMDEENLTLHPVKGQGVFAQQLLPAWFSVERHEILQVELPLPAFLLFKQACVLSDLAAADSLLESQKFKKAALLKQTGLSTDWAKIFTSGPQPSDEHLRLLLDLGLLRKVTTASLEIGPVGQPLAAAISDLDLCSLTVSLQTWEDAIPRTGLFLYGAGRLFQVDVAPDSLRLRQLASRLEALTWLEELLLQGSQSHYPDYIVHTASLP
jgi:hypothetical protein